MTEKKVLIIDDQADILELVEMYIESEFDFAIIKAKSGKEAINILKNDQGFDIVVSDYNMPDGHGGDVFRYVRDEVGDIPFILLSTESPKNHSEMKDFMTDQNSAHVNKPFQSDELLATISTLTEQKLESVKSGHRKVRIDKFIKFNKQPIDIFIKLSDEKFVQIFKSDGPLAEAEDIEKYKKKGVEFLYAPTDSYVRFIQMTADDLILKLKDMTSFPNQTKNQINAVEMIHSLVEDIGLTKQACELAAATVDSVSKNLIHSLEKDLGKSPQNKKIMGVLKDMMNDSAYTYQLSIMTSTLAIGTLIHLPWNSDANRNKMVLASLFQDILLKDDILAKITDIKSKDFASLNQKEKSLVKEHMAKALDLIQSLEDVDTDCRSLIMCHHELPDGSGFPRGLTHSNTPQLSCVYNIAHYTASELIKRGLSKFEIVQVLNDAKVLFNHGNYKTVLESFLKNFE